jgi:uncharacterized protein YceH (UPF0502 family)
MSIDTISKLEARLLGVLIEKAMTTPENYPLSVNAAVNGANQKSNRDPVLDLDEDEVFDALERLVDRGLAKRVFPGHSRVEKFAHSAGAKLGLNSVCLAVLAELLLRGPQTVGELRTRARRMAPLESLEVVQETLQKLADNRLSKRLPPEPGGRAERFAQLLCPDAHPLDAPAAARAAATAAPPDLARDGGLVELGRRVEELERRLGELERQLGIGS